MSKCLWRVAALALLVAMPNLGAAATPDVPAAIHQDPAPNPAHPPRTHVLYVPSGGVDINALVYAAAGSGAKPTVVVLHGWPGNEKNLDLARSVQRAGWNAVSFNYRGSWGSPGDWSPRHTLEDAKAVLAYLRDPAHAAALGVDPQRIVLVGHSLGGWVSAHTLADDPGLLGAALISTGDMGAEGLRARRDRPTSIKRAYDNRQTLQGITPEQVVDELAANAEAYHLPPLAPKLVGRKLLVLTTNDGLQGDSGGLVNAVRARGGAVETVYEPTDHVWSDKRVRLQAIVLNWLAQFESPR